MSEVPSFLGVVASWLPMIVLLAVFIWYFQKISPKKGLSYSVYMEEHLDEIKRQNAVLEEILREFKECLARERAPNKPMSS